jgi:hypothetical protein
MLGRPKHRWKDNIKIDLKEIVYEDMDCIHVAQDMYLLGALVNTVMNLRAP